MLRLFSMQPLNTLLKLETAMLELKLIKTYVLELVSLKYFPPTLLLSNESTGAQI